jgi:hypothetical protein
MSESNGKVGKRFALALILLSIIVSLLAGMVIGNYVFPHDNPTPSPTQASSRTFIFDWPADSQKIINATLRVNMTFTINGDSLNVLTIINDTNVDGCLMISFDTDNNGIIGFDKNYLMFDNNMTIFGFVGQWQTSLMLPRLPPQKSTFHTCIFDGTKYIFNATYSISNYPIYPDIVQMNYGTFHKGDNFIVVCFHWESGRS